MGEERHKVREAQRHKGKREERNTEQKRSFTAKGTKNTKKDRKMDPCFRRDDRKEARGDRKEARMTEG